VIPGRYLMVLGVLAFVLFALLTMPARSILSFTGVDDQLSYGEVSGDIRRIELTRAAWRGILFDRIVLEPSFLSLVTFNPSARVSLRGHNLSGTLDLAKGEEVNLRDISLQSDVELSFGQMAARGLVVIKGMTLSLDAKGRCKESTLNLRTNILAELMAPLKMEAPVMEGVVRCSGAVFEIMLGGHNNVVRVEANGRVDADGTVPLAVTFAGNGATPLSDDLQSLLEFAGFSHEVGQWAGTITMELF